MVGVLGGPVAILHYCLSPQPLSPCQAAPPLWKASETVCRGEVGLGRKVPECCPHLRPPHFSLTSPSPLLILKPTKRGPSLPPLQPRDAKALQLTGFPRRSSCECPGCFEAQDLC